MLNEFLFTENTKISKISLLQNIKNKYLGTGSFSSLTLKILELVPDTIKSEK